MWKKSLLFFLASQSLHAELVDKIAASINGDIILYSEIKDFQKNFEQLRHLDQRFSQIDPGKIQDIKFSLDLLVEDMLIKQYIKSNSWEASEQDIDREVEYRAKELQISIDQLKAALKEEGSNFNQYRETIKKSIERQTLYGREISSRVSISKADIETFVREQTGGNPDDKFEYDLAYLRIPYSYSGDKRSAFLEEVNQSIKSGKNIGFLNKKYSILSPSLTEFEEMSDEALAKPLRGAINRATIGGLTEAIYHEDAVHVFLVKNRKAKGKNVSQKDEEKIKNYLYQNEFIKQLNFWVQRQKAKSLVRINL